MLGCDREQHFRDVSNGLTRQIAKFKNKTFDIEGGSELEDRPASALLQEKVFCSKRYAMLSKVARHSLLGVILVGVGTIAPVAYGMFGDLRELMIAQLQYDTKRAAVDQRFEAAGVWYTEDGEHLGNWSLSGPIRLVGDAMWCATLVVSEDSSTTATDKNGDRPPPAQPNAYISVAVTIGKQGIEFRADRCTDGSETSVATTSKPPLFGSLARAVLRGSLVEGQFATGDGSPGYWHGWWHAWKSDVPGVGYTDVEVR